MKANLFTSILLAVAIYQSTISKASAEKCPEVFDPTDLIFYPHPTDCSKFYFCGHSGPVEKTCPPGLHWSSNANVCDWPALAGCGEASTEAPSSTVVVSTTPTTPTSTTAATPTGKCPEVLDPNHTAFLPHADCSKFYVCTLDGPVETKCPAGLHWNQQASICDWPNVAGCDVSASTTTEVPRPTEAREAVGECPELYDPDNEVFLRHASDCTKYYLCTWGGVAVVQYCPAGLHWNNNTNQCDWPALAGCAVFDRDIHFSRKSN